MKPATQPERWQDTLAEVESAIQNCVAALDRYEKAFDGVLHATGTHPRSLPAAEPLTEWDARLSRVRTHTDAVETLLDEQEAEWKEWLAKYAAWRQAVEQPPG